MTRQHDFQQVRAEARNEAEGFAAKAGASIDVREEFVELPGGGVKQPNRGAGGEASLPQETHPERSQIAGPNDGDDGVRESPSSPPSFLSPSAPASSEFNDGDDANDGPEE